MDRAELESEKNDRKIFQRVFCKSPEGAGVLSWILNECGYYSQDPRVIDPLLIAFANKLLKKIGIIHYENIFACTQAIIDLANGADLAAEEAAIKAQEELV